ncbi:hypothetical protein TcWFU_008741 [Taenia crassiceps]|uniref:Uncharacterized protein n=1 Tax=Taenia crassiceps TaxID=6207 RepID=A0ABR4Q404_9CEST
MPPLDFIARGSFANVYHRIQAWQCATPYRRGAHATSTGSPGALSVLMTLESHLFANTDMDMLHHHADRSVVAVILVVVVVVLLLQLRWTDGEIGPAFHLLMLTTYLEICIAVTKNRY